MTSGGSGGPLDFDDDPEDAARPARPARREDPELIAEGRSATGREQAQPKPRRPARAPRYGWFVGVVGVLIISLSTVHAFRTERPGPRGIASGGDTPPFAAPLAVSALAAANANDVNVAVRRGQGEAGGVPACCVRGPDVVKVCALYERGLVVLALFATRSSECIEQLDRLDDAARRHPAVAFAAVSIRGDLDDVREVVRDRRWTFPVGCDDDGILAGVYGVAVCPQITFVREGGRVTETSLGAISPGDLEARVLRLER